MDSVKTTKGTVLPIMNLKGKPYLPVAARVQWFREDHPEGQIRTVFLALEETFTIAKAIISIKNPDGNYVPVSEGTKRETKGDFNDHTEKAESGAIGRALGLLGYGTQFALELEEGTRIVDAPATRPVADPFKTEPLHQPEQPVKPSTHSFRKLPSHSANANGFG